MLLILTIQRWFDTSFPPEIQMDLYFGLFSVTWLTKGSIYIYLFFVCTCWRIDYLCWYLLRSVVNVFYLLTVLCCIIYIEIYLYLCTACINIFWDKQCFNGNLFLKKRKSHYLFAIFAMIYIKLYIWFNVMSVFWPKMVAHEINLLMPEAFLSIFVHSINSIHSFNACQIQMLFIVVKYIWIKNIVRNITLVGFFFFKSLRRKVIKPSDDFIFETII